MRTGKEYLAAQKDGRAVYIDGELVADVTQDPRLSGGAQTVAELYDLQNRPDIIDTMSYLDPAGHRIGRTFQEPRSRELLTTRSEAIGHWMRHTFGIFGRSPDYMNVILASMNAGAAFFDESTVNSGFAAHVRAYYDFCSQNDLALTHVNVNPQVDRTKPVHEQEFDLACKVVKETDAGFYISGARMVATLGALADELLFMPSGMVPAAEAAADYALMFALPAATDGLKIICRPTITPQNAGHPLDHPLSSRFDETDAYIIFDNVFVPWERAFIYRDPALYNTYYGRTLSGNHQLHQGLIRSVCKAEFFTGLACYLAQATNVDQFPNVKNTLARLLLHTETQRILVERLDEKAEVSEWGTYIARTVDLDLAHTLFYEKFEEMVAAIRTIGAGGIVAMPSYADLDGPLSEQVGHFYRSANLDSADRIQLFRLAADAAISTLAGRQVLYEQYYAGDPVRRANAVYNRFPKDHLLALVEEALAQMKTR
ncbi:MAG: hypothetical protein KDE34_19410 [Anaerolineales bacterium]|nr:hypothetical protein [Anaerolineales bacterium]